MNKTIKNINSKWYLFALAAIVCPISAIYFVDLVNMPRNEETLTVFIASCSLENGNLVELLKENKPDYLRQINVNSRLINDEYYETYLTANLLSADMFILPESKATSLEVGNYFAPIEEATMERYVLAPSYYQEKDVHYGIRLHAKGGTLSNAYFTYSLSEQTDEDYYIFFNVNSMHIGDLSHEKYDTALIFSEVLIDVCDE